MSVDKFDEDYVKRVLSLIQKQPVKPPSADDLENVQMFLHWMRDYSKKYLNQKGSLNEAYEKRFSPEFRSSFYDFVYKFYSDENHVTDEIVYYWKLLAVDLMNCKPSVGGNPSHIKTKYIKVDDEEKKITIERGEDTWDISMEAEKSMFRCLMSNGNFLCYFKNNGTKYYIS